MAKIVGAPSLDGALLALGREVSFLEERGERTLIFCEDRLTLLAERAVLSVCGGTFFTQVTTFARFLSGPSVLSKEGSVLEISSLLTEHASELVCFRPRAAQAVYETIAQLAASRVDGDALRKSAEETEGALRGKLSDLALLLDRYNARLSELGLVDESGYLALLPEKLSPQAVGNVNVIFFGFGSFTRQALEGVRAAMFNARSVRGIFLAGNAPLYTNEAARLFRAVCEEYGGAETVMARDDPPADARLLRGALFSPESLSAESVKTQNVRRFTALDEAEELSVVAALIKKHVSEGARYRDVVVLVPAKESFFTVEKVFRDYKIPFFADKKRPFSEHPFCALALDLLAAVSDGALPEEADAVASSYYFGEGDEYRNYLLKYGGYRGGVRRAIRDDVPGYDKNALALCRERMLSMLALFPRKGKGKEFTAGVRALCDLVNAEERTCELAAFFTGAERAFLDLEPLYTALSEIECVAGERVFTAAQFCDGLKSALSSMEIAMIPRSLDCVFVGDATESKFARAPILFVCGLTDELPRVSSDTAVITDGEMERLSAIKVEIEPAIAQVNARARENLGLNLCAFSSRLYLSRPLRRGNAEAAPSEIFTYAERIFEMPPMPELFPFDCSEELPAALAMLSLRDGFRAGRVEESRKYSALYKALGAPEKLFEEKRSVVPAAGKLIFSSGLSPSLFEKYFGCPYAGFTRALRLREREERPVKEADAGTIIHAVLEKMALRFNRLESEADCRDVARGAARELLLARYSALFDTPAGTYTAERLVEEAAEVSAAAYRQLALSAFRVREAEEEIRVPELLLSGKTDRVDVSDEFVRVIDYKTGDFDESPAAYYTGRSLQLELYLRGAAKDGRPAGAFYFPAADNFTAKDELKYRMSGFYCGEKEVVVRLDRTLQPGQTSALFEGKYADKLSGRGMSREDFDDFLRYSVLVAQKAENEMRSGNILPSPYAGECKYCKMRSLCGFVGTPRKEPKMTCAEIVEIVRRERGDK